MIFSSQAKTLLMESFNFRSSSSMIRRQRTQSTEGFSTGWGRSSELKVKLDVLSFLRLPPVDTGWYYWCAPRAEGHLSGSDGHSVETRVQPGHPLLRHDSAEELVQRCVSTCNNTLVTQAEPLEWLFLATHQGDDPNKAINPMVTGAFGAVAGAASVFGNTPLDVIKTRMQVGVVTRSSRLRLRAGFLTCVRPLWQGLEAHKYKSTLDCAVKIMKHEGPKA